MEFSDICSAKLKRNIIIIILLIIPIVMFSVYIFMEMKYEGKIKCNKYKLKEDELGLKNNNCNDTNKIYDESEANKITVSLLVSSIISVFLMASILHIFINHCDPVMWEKIEKKIIKMKEIEKQKNNRIYTGTNELYLNNKIHNISDLTLTFPNGSNYNHPNEVCINWIAGPSSPV